MLGVRTNIAKTVIAKTLNTHIEANAYWDTGINQGIIIASDRTYSSHAQVWLVKGTGSLTQIDAGGSSIAPTTGIAIEWKDGTVQFKGRSANNVLTCFSIGLKYT